MMKKQIRTLHTCSRRASWNGILSALLIASLLLSLSAVVLHETHGAQPELARDSAFAVELPAKVVWTLIRAVSEHWVAPNAPVASVNWTG